MDKILFTQEEAVALIRKWQGKMTLGAFAEKLGVSAQLVGDVYRGKILPSKKLGFEKVVSSFRYRLLKSQQ